MAAQKPARTRRDRWADWVVIGVLALALLLGWAVMAFAQGRTVAYADADAGLSLRYPRDWFLKSDDKLAFQAVDSESGNFKTTYQVRIEPIDTTAGVTPTLVSVLNGASLSRAQEGTAYRLLDILEGKPVDDQPTMEATYVYVVESADLFSQRMPVVVMGLDVAVARGDRAYVFSLLASEHAFADAEQAFYKFVKSAEMQ